MTEVRCPSSLPCPSRTAGGACGRDVVVLAGFDAHCSHGEEARLERHRLMLEGVRARDAKGVKALDIWEEE